MDHVAALLAPWSDTLTMKQWEIMITYDVLLFSATNEELNTLRAAPTSLRKASVIGLSVLVLTPPPPTRISIDLKQRMHMPLSPTIRMLGQTSGEYAIKYTPILNQPNNYVIANEQAERRRSACETARKM